ncbi:hypothetical protein MMC28_004819 [Mycoblastus sanguinarius]|nr:hypothetical protein [Mycoblastus sanguinarius]
MAEFIIGAVSLGVAGPSLVVAFAQCGEYFREQISNFKDAPSLIQEMAKFGSRLYNGRIKDDLALATWAYDQKNISTSLKDAIEDQIDRLKLGLIQADKVLQKSLDKNGEVKRTYFMITGERKLARVIKDQ